MPLAKFKEGIIITRADPVFSNGVGDQIGFIGEKLVHCGKQGPYPGPPPLPSICH